MRKCFYICISNIAYDILSYISKSINYSFWWVTKASKNRVTCWYYLHSLLFSLNDPLNILNCFNFETIFFKWYNVLESRLFESRFRFNSYKFVSYRIPLNIDLKPLEHNLFRFKFIVSNFNEGILIIALAIISALSGNKLFFLKFKLSY